MTLIISTRLKLTWNNFCSKCIFFVSKYYGIPRAPVKKRLICWVKVIHVWLSPCFVWISLIAVLVPNDTTSGAIPAKSFTGIQKMELTLLISDIIFTLLTIIFSANTLWKNKRFYRLLLRHNTYWKEKKCFPLYTLKNKCHACTFDRPCTAVSLPNFARI